MMKNLWSALVFIRTNKKRNHTTLYSNLHNRKKNHGNYKNNKNNNHGETVNIRHQVNPAPLIEHTHDLQGTV